MFHSSLSLVLPAYNEEELLPETLEALCDYLPSRFPSFQLIVVDDGSADRTAQVVQEFHANHAINGSLRLIQQEKNYGKGCAVRRGIQACNTDLAFFMDSDLPYDLSAIDRIAAALESGHALAIGSRELSESKIETQVPFLRFLAGQSYSLLIRALLFPGIPDTQCGIKGFQTPAAQDIFRRMTIGNFGFDVELLYIARKLGYSIQQIPVTMIDFRRNGRVRLFRDSLIMFLDLFRIRWNDLTGQYLPRIHEHFGAE